uniref:Sushi domain-containing protein n=1 Tax=Varanus komodoensis TaxID=61221 RepID=A0A8D2J5V3_VARKO
MDRAVQGAAWKERCSPSRIIFSRVCSQTEFYAEGKCPLPPLIENGDIVNIPKTEYLPGESVQYQCQNFYKMEGSPTVTCNNGDWSAEPRCLVPCTASEEDMGRNNIKLRWKSDTKLYSESGDTIEFTCIHDFSLAQGSPPFRAQCRDGTITYPRCRYSAIEPH